MPRFVNAKERIAKIFGHSALRADPEPANNVPGNTSEAPVEEIPADPAPGVTLLSFAFNPDTVVVSPLPLLFGKYPTLVGEVGLDAPAPPGGVQIDIWRHGSAVFFAGTIVVAEGEETGSGTVEWRGTSLIDREYEARLGDVRLTAVLHVVTS